MTNETPLAQQFRVTLEALEVAVEELAKAHEQLQHEYQRGFEHGWQQQQRVFAAQPWARQDEGAAHAGCCPFQCDLPGFPAWVREDEDTGRGNAPMIAWAPRAEP